MIYEFIGKAIVTVLAIIVILAILLLGDLFAQLIFPNKTKTSWGLIGFISGILIWETIKLIWR